MGNNIIQKDNDPQESEGVIHVYNARNDTGQLCENNYPTVNTDDYSIFNMLQYILDVIRFDVI